jgi:hypothetical protein
MREVREALRVIEVGIVAVDQQLLREAKRERDDKAAHQSARPETEDVRQGEG